MTHAKLVTTAIWGGVVLGILSMLSALIVLPLKYSADARILVAPREIPGVDPYTSSKAAERIAQNLAEVVHTSQFFNRVAATSLGIDMSYFPQDELERRKVWNETADASVTYNTGFLNITVYHPNPEQAVRIATAITQVMTAAGNEFAVSAADFRVSDTAIASKYPKQPNFPVIGLVGFIAGFAISAGYLAKKRKI